MRMLLSVRSLRCMLIGSAASEKKIEDATYDRAAYSKDQEYDKE